MNNVPIFLAAKLCSDTLSDIKTNYYRYEGLTALVSTSRADKGNHRISQFWQDFILKTYNWSLD